MKINKDNFESEVIKSELPVLLDFWAEWCGPCQMLIPVIAEIEEEYKGKIKVGKINVDEAPELAVAFNVSSIPTLVVMKDGKAVNGGLGYMSKDEVLKLLEI